VADDKGATHIGRRHLVRSFVSAMHEGEAALFVGAGLSKPAGFLNWKGLLKNCAIELGLDIAREHDLVAVAQYYLNRLNRDRAGLNAILRMAFDGPGTYTPNHRLIGRLPLTTVWTTNFDRLLERAFEAAGRKVEVKSRDHHLTLPSQGRQVTVYKMYGDIANPDEVIICKEDYEKYARRHPVFQNQLAADLVTKTFLFLGFTFTDPHLDYMLGHLRTLLEDSKREHFAVMRRARVRLPHPQGTPTKRARREYAYDLNKQNLQVEDLRRYSVHTYLVEKYTEVEHLLAAIEREFYQRNVFVSGSAHQFGDFGEERMRDFCIRLGERLIECGYKVISGMGLNIGDSVVKGALLKIYERTPGETERRLMVRPFPRTLPPGNEAAFNRQYRMDMIERCGFAVFVAGTSRTQADSAGVLEEFDIAMKLGKIPVPVGATGFAARRIWETIEPRLAEVYKDVIDAELFRSLNDASLSTEELLQSVMTVIERVAADDTM
jgi:hypothetical protein